MEILLQIEKNDFVKIIQTYIDKYIQIEYCFLKRSGRVHILNKIFEEPSKESLWYLLNVLANIKLSPIILYWTIYVLEKLQSKSMIMYDIYNIHYIIPIIYDIGSKLVEDNGYAIQFYMDMIHVTFEYLVKSEMCIFLKILKIMNPYDVFLNIDPRIHKLVIDVQQNKNQNKNQNTCTKDVS